MRPTSRCGGAPASRTIHGVSRSWRSGFLRRLHRNRSDGRITVPRRGCPSRLSRIGTKPDSEPSSARRIGKPSATGPRAWRSSRRYQKRQTVPGRTSGAPLPSGRHSSRCTALPRRSWPTTTVIHGTCVNAEAMQRSTTLSWMDCCRCIECVRISGPHGNGQRNASAWRRVECLRYVC